MARKDLRLRVEEVARGGQTAECRAPSVRMPLGAPHPVRTVEAATAVALLQPEPEARHMKQRHRERVLPCALALGWSLVAGPALADDGLKVTAASAAEAAGMSRVTLHRIEHGEPSVTFGSYLSVLAALGLDFAVVEPGAAAPSPADSPPRKGWIPARIRLADYPQLKRVAWQVQGVDEVTPAEAFDLYERSARHLNPKAMDARERELLNALRLAFGETSHAGV